MGKACIKSKSTHSGGGTGFASNSIRPNFTSAEYKISPNKISGKTNKSVLYTVQPFSTKTEKLCSEYLSVCWWEKFPENDKSVTLIFGTLEYLDNSKQQL